MKRYQKYIEKPFDTVILLINNGTIKCGRYADLVKVDDDKRLRGKEFFNEDSERE
jgi:alpha-D-ribose 1-methylphosphonate 5-triphosphate diphosphatase PhnM